MKLTATLTLLTVALTASAKSLPDLFTLTAVFPHHSHLPAPQYSTLMYANSSAYVGDIKYEYYSEPLILSGGREPTTEFTSIHAAPTGGQTPYILPFKSSHIGFTVPHSGTIPPGGQATRWRDIGGFLKVDIGDGPESHWVACAVDKKKARHSYIIAWDGKRKLAKVQKCVKIHLKVNPTGDSCA